MGIYADETLRTVLAPFLEKSGYKPTARNYDFVFTKDRLVFIVSYDPRDDASIWFGALSKPVDPVFGDFDTYSLRNLLLPYEHWLKLLSIDFAKFSLSCGGWETNSLRTPDFLYLSSVIIDTLLAAEQLALKEH